MSSALIDCAKTAVDMNITERASISVFIYLFIVLVMIMTG
jgi:hypothetical protein